MPVTKSSGSVTITQKKEKPVLDINLFYEEALAAHNLIRSRHNAPPLTFNPEISKIAQSYAEQLADCFPVVQHSTNVWNGEELGENIAVQGGALLTGGKVSFDWHSEIKYYDQLGFCEKTGHFTQLIWKNSKEVGFGIFEQNGYYFAVANYYPAGNVMGEFEENVDPNIN